MSPSVIAYTLNVVGLFFLASAITFKKPRREIEEILGVERPRSISAVHGHLVNKIQVYIGFVLLVGGYVLLMGQALIQSGAEEGLGEDRSLLGVGLLLLFSTAATLGVLRLLQLLFTRRKFRRLLAEVLRESGFALEKNQNLAIQIGELLGVPKTPDQSVPEFIAEVKRVLGLATPVQDSGSGRVRRTPRVVETPRA